MKLKPSGLILIIAALILIQALAACGQKGSLTLPDQTVEPGNQISDAL